MPRVTSADVARLSGVSRTTVSYVLNGTAGTSISEATRRRVLDAAAELGYAPSAAARTLRSGRSDLVLCVLPDWPVGPVVETMLDHLADELAVRGLSVLVHHVRGERPLADLWRAVTPRTVVGLTPFSPDEVRAMRRAGIQVVDTDAGDPDAEDPQPRIGRIQVDRLTPAVVPASATPPRRSARRGVRGDRRWRACGAACAELGLAEPLVIPVRVDPESGVAAVDVARRRASTGSPRTTTRSRSPCSPERAVAGLAVPGRASR